MRTLGELRSRPVPKKRANPQEAIERQHALDYLLDVLKEFPSQKAAAQALGVSPSLITEARSGSRPMAKTLIEAVARHKGVLPDVVLGRLKDHTVVLPARYPNLEEALTLLTPMLKEPDREEVLARARSIGQSWPTDRSVGEWVDQVKALARDVSRARKFGEAPRLLDDEDDTPPIGRE
jgi:transcriptional regulator with XRE-family HTH domain